MAVILYFASILVTCALCGFLALYAWRQRGVPGARVYAGLAFCECLLALVEILAMLSPSSEQALFWWKSRHLFSATIPVFWLVFAFEYGGWRGWRSKRVLVGLFIIPILTQVLLWSNYLHGLWVQQEVGWRQNGPFWIAETSARIPGLWFAVYVFYGPIVGLAGVWVLLVATWRMRRLYLGKALLVVGMALVVLVNALIPTFNLFPTEFNLITPSTGVGILLIGLVAFRFRALKPASAAEIGAADQPRAKSVRSFVAFMLIFIVMAVGILAGGYLSYQDYVRQFNVQVESTLSSIAELKVSEIQSWRQERMADAEFVRQNRTFAALVQRYLENPGDAQAQAELQGWLDKYQVYRHYDRVFLLDTRGVARISSPAVPEPVAAHLPQEIAAVLSAGQVTFLDFHRHENGSIYLALLVPVYTPQDNHPLGVFVLRVDPRVYLYPFIQQLPISSASAETLLIRREGTDALFLNELRFQSNAALNLRFSLQNAQLPAVKAALGQEGIVEGVDYRDVPALADVRAVPNSPWYLVTKMDTAEVYAPLQERLWQTVVFFGALMAIAGTALGLLWRHQRVRYYRELAVAERARRVSAREYQVLVRNIPGMVYRAGSDWKVKIASGAESLCGYTSDEINSMPRGWLNIIHPDDRDAVERVGVLLAREHCARVQLYRIIAKNGQTQWIEDHKVSLFSELGIFEGVDGIVMNITERKRAEEALQVERDLMQSVINGAGNAHLVYLDRDFNFVMVNETYAAACGYRPEEMIGKNHFVLYPHEENESIFRHVRDTGEPFSIRDKPFEYPGKPERGTTYWDWTLTPVKDREGWVSGLIFSLFETTERKRAEKALKASEEWLAETAKIARVGGFAVDRDGRTQTWTEETFRIYELPPGKAPDMTEAILFYHPEDRPGVSAAAQRAVERAEEVEFEARLITAKKNLIWVHVIAYPVFSEGRLVGVRGSIQDITARKRAEEKLRESEERFSLSMLASRDGIWDWNIAENRVYYSPSWSSILDETQVSPQLSTWEERIHPEDKTQTLAKLKEHLEGKGDNWQQEHRLKMKDGNWKWVLGRGMVVARDTEGKPLRMVGTMQDITERKRAEEALQLERDLMQSVINGAGNSHLVYLDRDFNFVLVNETYAAACGYRPEEMIGKNHFVLYPHEENESIFRHVRDTGEPFSIRDKPFEYPDQPGRGTTYWDWTLTPVKDREGWVSGLIFSLFETTERKRAEQALRESEARLKLAQSAARSGVWDYDVIKDELRWSDEYYELYGISKEVPPSREDWLLSIHPEDREMAAKSQGEAIVRREFTNFDFRITRPDGQVRWLATQGQVLLDPDNQPVRIIGTSMDITARKRAEEELARSEGRIRRRLESLLAPEGDIGTLELGDLLDIPALQALMEDFTRASGTATAILDTQGTVLVATGWQDICTRFHRVHQVTAAFCTESDLALAKDLKEGEYLAYKCRNNLRDVVTPLYIGGRHMGNIFTGQFFYDDDIVDESVFVAQAKAYGFDRDAYLDALHRVSRVSRDRVRARMEYLVRMTGFFSKLSYSNLSLARTVHQRDELVRSLQVSEEALREEKVLLAKSQAIAHVGSWEYDLTTNHLTWSDEVYRIFGCRPQEFAATYEAFLAFVHPDDRTAVNEAYSGLLREGADSYEIEHRIVQSGTGDIRWVHERCVHERDDAGKIIRSVGMVHAITARKRAEEALQRAHAELEARVVERTRELNRRIAQVETLNAATTNLLQDLRAANQVQQQTNQELARLHEQLREQRVAEQAALLKLSQALLGETDSQKIMDLAVREAAAALKVEIASLSLLEEDGEHISIRASLGWATELAQRVNHVPLAESGTTSQAIRNRTPFIRRGTVGEMPPPLPDIVSQVGIVATAVAPLLLGNNSVGTLAVGSRTPRDWADDDVRLLSLIASTTAQALERARLFEQVSAGRARFEVLSQRLVEIQESERRYIARELHDEIGQMLTGLKLLLTTEVGATTKRMRANADEARTLVGDLMMRVRELSLNLRPAMLDDLGLLPALLWFIGRYEKQTRVRVSFVHLGIEGARFSREIETTAYRIAQEALTNVARHAHVSEVSVRVWAHDRVLEIYVEDHGRGFDPAAELVAGKSSGLPGMRERAILIGGQLTLDSAPGTGTRVIAELPLGDRVERRSSDRLNPTSG